MPAPARAKLNTCPQWSRPPNGVDLGRAAEFGDGHHQRLVQQPALVQVFDQGRKTDVEHRAKHVLQPVGVLRVRVPQRIVDGRVARIARPADVHQPHAGLDQPPGQQHALPPAVLAVALADFVRLVADLEGLARLARGQQAEGGLANVVEVAHGAAAFDFVQMPADLVEQRQPGFAVAAATCRWLHAQALDLVVVGRRIADEPVGIPLCAQKAGGLPGGRHVVVEPHDVGNPHARQRRHPLARLEHLDDRAEVGPIAGLDLAGAARVDICRRSAPNSRWCRACCRRSTSSGPRPACRRCAAVRGSSSQNWMPGTLVEMGLNGPRISNGRRGLGSNVSCCGGPPCSQR